MDCTEECSNGWFYTGKVPYFLEQNGKTKEEINDENTMKNESSTNPYNLEETKEEYKVSENNLIDQYDEETVLLQIPQEDTDGRYDEKIQEQEHGSRYYRAQLSWTFFCNFLYQFLKAW